MRRSAPPAWERSSDRSPLPTHRARHWRGHRRGHLVMAGLGAHYAGPGLMLSFVLSGLGCAFAGLCYAEFAAMIPLAGSAYTYAYATLGELIAWIIAGPHAGVRHGCQHGQLRLVQLLRRDARNLSYQVPLWLAYDHWTALSKAVETVSRQVMAQLSLPHPWHAGVHHSARPAQGRAHRRHDGPGPRRAGRARPLRPRDRGQPSRLPHRSRRYHRVAIGIQESAKFNTGIVALKVAVVLLVLGLGSHYVHPPTGEARGTPLRPMDSPASARARPTSSSPTSASTRFPPPHRRPRIRSEICPSESSFRWSSAPCST